jgi:hypothetical protein
MFQISLLDNNYVFTIIIIIIIIITGPKWVKVKTTNQLSVQTHDISRHKFHITRSL